MGISNIIALFIMITTAATLNAHGVTDIQTSSQGIVTLPREERERTIRGTDFHAAATTSRHVLIAAARSTRCD